MTLDQIKASDKDMLIPADICGILGVSQYTINLQVKHDKEHGINSFPFPTILLGTRVKIPRIAFIRAMEGISYKEETA